MKELDKLKLFRDLKTLEGELQQISLHLYMITDNIQESLTDEQLKEIGGKDIPFIEYIKNLIEKMKQTIQRAENGKEKI